MKSFCVFYYAVLQRNGVIFAVRSGTLTTEAESYAEVFNMTIEVIAKNNNVDVNCIIIKSFTPLPN
jgi:hypothetical protein